MEGNWEYFVPWLCEGLVIGEWYFVLPCDSPLTFPKVHFISLSSVLYWSGYDQGVWGPGELHLRDSGYLVFGGRLGFR